VSYALAGGLAVVALGLTRVIWPVIEPTLSPLFLAAVVVSAWYGGLGPGMFATAVAAIGKTYFFALPARSLWIEDSVVVIHLAVFVAIACLISSLTGALRRARDENAALIAQERLARAEAENANRAKDVFLATVSHDLRTPLQAVSSWLAVLRRRVSGGDVVGALDGIERSVAAQNRLIEDLLDVSRIATGTMQLDLAKMALPPVIETAAARAQAARPGHDVVLTLDLDPAAGPILGDAARLEQVVSNLVSNALKFTTAPGRVEVSLRRAGDHVRLVVTDTGCGIPAETLSRVFEEFFQDRRATATAGGGLGLGLAIVRRIVELHGGTVQARSDGPGRGSTFVVELPSADAATPPLRRGRLRTTADVGPVAG
jgi:signal transduction histidine kinase